MPKLLNVPISPFGIKVQMAMLEKGIAFETREPDLEAAQAGRDQELTSEASPRLEIPLLIDDGLAIWDSTIILEYLEDRWPSPPLLPHGAADRARVRMLEDVCDTTYEAAVWGIYETTVMGRLEGAAKDALVACGKADVEGLNAWLERQLAGRPWFNGDAFGWGDCSVFPPVQNADRLGYPPPSGGRLATWLATMRERPSARRLDEELTAWFATPLNRPTDTTGTWKRLYKAHRLEWMVRSGGLDVVAEGIRHENIRFSPAIA